MRTNFRRQQKHEKPRSAEFQDSWERKAEQRKKQFRSAKKKEHSIRNMVDAAIYNLKKDEWDNDLE